MHTDQAPRPEAPPERVTVLRGDLPCPGVRAGRVAAYEFDIPEHMYVRPGAGRRQRAFLLLDESVQLNQPVVFKPERAGWWYVDLVEIRETRDTIHVADHYVDFIVGPPGQPYRVLDLHELGEALTSGALTTRQVAHVLAAAQSFADTYLQGEGHHGPHWPDFPPAALAPVREAEIPPLSPRPAIDRTGGRSASATPPGRGADGRGSG